MTKKRLKEQDTSITLQPGVSRSAYEKIVVDKTVRNSKSADERGAKNDKA